MMEPAPFSMEKPPLWEQYNLEIGRIKEAAEMKNTSTFDRLRSILLTTWDPVGIADAKQADDEYDAYARQIESLLLAGASMSRIKTYLLSIEADEMGLVPDRKRAECVAIQIREMHQAG